MIKKGEKNIGKVEHGKDGKKYSARGQQAQPGNFNGDRDRRDGYDCCDGGAGDAESSYFN